MFTDIDAEAAAVHEANKNWWIDIKTGLPLPERNRKEVLALAISEVTEALEHWRKKDRKDDKLPHLPGAAVELADCMIRLLDTAAGFGLLLSHKVYNNIVIGLLHDTWHNSLVSEDLFDVMMSIARLQYWARNKPDTVNCVGPGTLLTTSIALCFVVGAHWYGHEVMTQAFREKMIYNATREDHKIEHRLNAPDGKLC